MRTTRIVLLAILCAAIIAPEVEANGGPWTQKPGKVKLTMGYSRKTAGSRWTNGVLDTPPDSTLVDGLFHDFRYGYVSGAVGIVDGLELSGTINYLWGYERVSRDPKTNQPHKPMWEVNSGFTDSWLNLKYQFLQGDYPLAVMVSTRFPDLYDDPSDVYSRYSMRTCVYAVTEQTPEGKDTVFRRTDTVIDATGEWRGLLKRDLGIHVLAGHSFDGKGYMQASLAYNFRQGAYADQVIFTIDGGYSIPVLDEWTVMPKLAFDYTGGLGNGGLPDSTDRFQSRDSRGVGQRNVNFNNGRYGRVYGSVIVGPSDGKYGLDLGVGRWVFGNGSARYWETYAQLTYQF